MENGTMSPIELDALKEVANIGAGNASVALSALLNQKVRLDVPRTNIVLLKEVYNLVTSKDGSVVGIFTKVNTGMEGNVLLLFPASSSMQLIGHVAQKDFRQDTMSKDDLKILEKIGTVLTAAYLNSLSQFFEQRIIYQPPKMISAIGDSVVDFVMAQIDEKEQVLLITISFEVEEKKIEGSFVLLFTISSLAPLLTKLSRKLGS